MYSLEDIRQFRQSRGKKRLVLDTNLLLLLLVGGCDEKLLEACECVKNYSSDNYNLLLKILLFFDSEIIITPHTLAEFSNLSKRDIKEPKIHYYVSTVVAKLKNYREEYISLEKLLGVKVKLLARFGFPDMSIVEVAKKIDAVILSDDLGLCLYGDSCLVPNIYFKRIISNNLITSSI